MGDDRLLTVALMSRPYLKAGGDGTEEMSPLKCLEGNASGTCGSEEAPPH